MEIWNPWHGCHKISEGCLNCYMFRRDAMYDKDSNIVTKTSTFNAPVKRSRDGEEADEWRKEAWAFIRERNDLSFCIITKRIERFEVSLPDDWGDGYENVTIYATCENQKRADERMPIMLRLPIKHREIIHEPMLGQIDIEKYLLSGKIEQVTCGGESGDNARPCHYEWILHTREQCLRTNTPFYFKQTGARFVKDGRLYLIKRKDQSPQARKAGINL